MFVVFIALSPALLHLARIDANPSPNSTAVTRHPTSLPTQTHRIIYPARATPRVPHLPLYFYHHFPFLLFHLSPPPTCSTKSPNQTHPPSTIKPHPMADYSRGGDRGLHQQQQPQHQKQQSTVHQLVKAVTAVATGGSLLAISGLTLAGTLIALALATPLLVIFSPVLVPAAIAIVLIGGGFLISGGFGVVALSVLAWMYKYMTGKRPMGADQIDHARARIAAKARDIKESAQQKVEQATS